MSQKKEVGAIIGKEGILTQMTCRNHRYVCDEEPQWGGQDKAPDPYDYIMSGLAACIAISLRQYADQKDWPLDSAAVNCFYESRDTPDHKGREDRVTTKIHLAGALQDNQRTELLKIAESPAYKMLSRGIEIRIESTGRF